MAQPKIEKNKNIQPFKKAAARPRRMIWGSVEINPFLFNQTFQRWVLGVVFALILAFLFEYPRVGDTDTYNYKVGDVAEQDIYAPVPIPVPDKAKTEKDRDEEASKVRPVFEYNSPLARKIANRVSAAFEDIRGFYQREWDWEDAEKQRINYLRTVRRNRRAKPIPFIPDDNDLYESKKAEAEQKFLEMAIIDIGDKPLELKSQHWAALKRERFSKVIENKVIVLIMQVMNEGVVLTKDKFPPPGSEILGISVAEKLPSGEYLPDLRVKTETASIHVLKAVPKVIEDRADREYSGLRYWLRQAIIEIASQTVKPNYSFSGNLTEKQIREARDSVDEVSVIIKEGTKIVGQGEPITEDILKRLNSLREVQSQSNPVWGVLGNFIWLMTLISVIYVFSNRNIRKFKPTIRDLLQIAVTTVFLVILLKLGLQGREGVSSQYGFELIYIVPMLAGAMLVRLLINSEASIIYSIFISIVSALLVGDQVYGLYVLVGSIVGAEEVGQAKTRSTLVKAGVMTGAANVIVIMAITITKGEFVELYTFYNMLMGLICGIIGSFLVLGVTPLFEYSMGYVTDIRLLELANQEHPLLKALIMNAPGTYQHSVTVGILAEEAAMAIHVNPLLVKVAALYHDIGKMEKPDYFVENQREETNPHDTLNPTMSTLIISSHVKYGMELAKMYRLPQVIVDAIPQHHGTSLMKYFYARAKEREDPDLSMVEEKNFRYPGPKPQTREMAILMLADSVEAAARSVPDPTPVKLRNMVRKIIGNIFDDGQLDECDLTLKDLNSIGEAFTNTLSHMYHSRPEYPELPSGRKKSSDERKSVADQNKAREAGVEGRPEGERADKEKGKKDIVRTKA